MGWWGDGLILYTFHGGNVSDFHAKIRCLLRGGGGGLILNGRWYREVLGRWRMRIRRSCRYF